MERKRSAILGRKYLNYKVLIIVIAIVALAIAGITTGNIAGKWNGRERYSFSFSATGLNDGSGNAIDISGGGRFSPKAMMGYMYYYNIWLKANGHITFNPGGIDEIKSGWKSDDGLYGFQQIVPALNMTAKLSGRTPSWSDGTIKVSLIEGSDTTSGIVTVYAGPATYSGTGIVVVN